MNQLLCSFDEFLRLQRHRSPETAKRYGAIVSNFLDFLPNTGLDDIERVKQTTEMEIRNFLTRASATKAGEPSGFMWNQKLAAVRTLFRFLKKQKIMPDNPASEIAVKEAEPDEKVPLSLTEVVALLWSIDQRPEPFRSRDWALAQVGFHCALRVHELHRLDLTHLDFHHGYIVNLRTKRKKYLLLPLPPLAAQALQRWIALRAQFNPAPGEKAVFLSERGTRLSVRQMQELVARYAREAGILRRISPHYLRHSIATVHALIGTKPWDIQRLLNHKSLSTTEHYIHTLETLRAAMLAVDAELAHMLNHLAPISSQILGEGAPMLLGTPSLPAECAPFP